MFRRVVNLRPVISSFHGRITAPCFHCRELHASHDRSEKEKMSTYSARGIQPPSVESLREGARHHGLRLTDTQLQEYADIMAGFVPAFTYLENLPEPTLPVKYPRTPGYRPEAEENPYGAWYRRCDIPGADNGPLAGKTVAIKDNIAVAGVPMMNGSRILEGYVPEFDATVVTRILDAGGCIAGKAVCEDLCVSPNSLTSPTGLVRNPRDTTRAAGGSSSGCGALVASGAVDLAIGGDQSGSIRIPASWCGIVGLKPTWGLVPYAGAMSFEPTLDHLGPMARTVREVAELLEVIAGPDDGDFRTKWAESAPTYTRQLTERLDGMKVGFVKEGFENCEEAVQEVAQRATGHFEAVGAVVEWVSIPEQLQANKIVLPIRFGGVVDMKENEGSPIGCKGFYPTSLSERVRQGFKSHQNDLSDNMKLSLLFGDYIKRNYGNYFYHKAQNLNARICKGYDDVLAEYDVLYMPTLPRTAPTFPPDNVSVKELLQNHFYGINVNTAPANYTGHPALSLPVGALEGLPVGGMLVGGRGADARVLQVAYALEQQMIRSGEMERPTERPAERQNRREGGIGAV